MTDALDDAPQLERGYMPIAHELLPGLMLAPIYHEAKLILMEVVMRWAGKAKATTFTIDVKAIAKRWGVKRTNVWRGFRQLKAAGVLVASVDDELTVTIDKRALMKLLPENIRAGVGSFGSDAAIGTWFGVKIESAKSVSDLIRQRIASDSERITDDTLSRQNRITGDTHSLEDRITGDTHTVSSVIQNRITGDTLSTSPLDPPNRKRIEEKKERIQAGGPDSIQFTKSLPANHPDHPCNADDRTPHAEFVHNGPSMPENFGELTRKAFDLFRGRDTAFPNVLAGKQSDAVWIDLFLEIPADLWHDALRDVAAKKDPEKWNVGFYLGCVKHAWRSAKDRRRMAENAAQKPKPPEPEYNVASPAFLAKREAYMKRRQAELGISA